MLDTTRHYLVENVSLQNSGYMPMPGHQMPEGYTPPARRFEVRFVEVDGEGNMVADGDRITVNTTDASNLPTVNDIVDVSFVLTL